jgi:glycosyltransferase involved in cell wall biosynthesis
MNQTFKEFEVIIINDGSTDDSENISLGFVESDKRFSYYKQKNKGKSTAVNNGYQKSKGDYIYVLDSDDFIEKNLFKRTIMTAIQYGVDIVNFNYYYIEDGQKSIKTTNFTKNKILDKNEIKRLLKTRSNKKNSLTWFTWSNLIKKSLLDEHNILHDEKQLLGSDTSFNLQCYLNANSIYSIDDTLINYVHRENSMSQLKYKTGLLNEFEIQFNNIKAIYKKLDLKESEFIGGFLDYYISHSLFFLINNEKNSINGLKISDLNRIRNSEVFNYCFKYYTGLKHEPFRKRLIVMLFKHKQFWTICLLNKITRKIKPF